MRYLSTCFLLLLLTSCQIFKESKRNEKENPLSQDDASPEESSTAPTGKTEGDNDGLDQKTAPSSPNTSSPNTSSPNTSSPNTSSPNGSSPIGPKQPSANAPTKPLAPQGADQGNNIQPPQPPAQVIAFDNQGFDQAGLHRDTGTAYDPQGYDRAGRSAGGEYRSTHQLLAFDPVLADQQRRDFRAQTFESQHVGYIRYYGIGAARTAIAQGNPAAPLFHSYHDLGTNAYFWAKLPAAFLAQIPAAIRAELLRHDLTSIDLYFVPEGPVSFPLEYKGCYWLHPEVPNPIPAGTYAQGNILVGLYEPSQPAALIEERSERNYLNFATLVEKSYSLHDDRVSPDHGKIADVERLRPLSFWSLSVSVTAKKAAVSLHWILDFPSSRALRELIENGANHFDALIPALEADANYTVLAPSLRNFLGL